MYVIRKRFKQTDAEALDSKPNAHPVEVLAQSTIVEIRNDSVVVIDSGLIKKEVAYDTIVNCHTQSNTEFLEQLKAAGIHAVNVGDSKKVRGLHEAVKEGSDFGFLIDGNSVVNPNDAFVENIQLDIAAMLQ